MTRLETESTEIKELAVLAARAEASRLGPARRARILAAARQPHRVWPAWAGASLAAAALLVVLTAPALLLHQPAEDKALAGSGDLNLEVSLAGDGSVVLEWENGKTVHTVRKGTSARDLARANGIEVAGQRYRDASRSSAEIVYYQVD